MKTHHLFGLTALLALAFPSTTWADLYNPSFETGDFSSWSVNSPGLSEVVTGDFLRGTGDPVSPTDGSYFAILTAGDTDVYTTLSQGFLADVGDTLRFDVRFDGFDFFPFNDDAYARIIDRTTHTSTVLYAQDILSVGDFGHDGWTTISYSVTTADIYLLEFGIRNVLDDGFSSRFFVDNIRGTIQPVPTPGSLALLCIGGLSVVGIVPYRRRKI